MKLKERTAAILTLLLEDEMSFKSVSEIAERLGVSTKTISRELGSVEEALQTLNLTLQKKKGAGLAVAGVETAMVQARERLTAKKKNSYTPAERRSIIVSRLLPSKEPVKLFALSSLLKVTDGTISNDLDKLEGWFRQHGLTLVRKPGLGVYIEGEERSIRRAIVAYFYDHIEENELLNLVNLNLEEKKETRGDKASRYLLDLVDTEIIFRLEQLVHQAEIQMERKLADDAFIGLIVHLALGVQRLRKKENIQIPEDVLKELRLRPEFAVAQWLGEHIAEAFDLTVSLDEVGYITMHLLGARSRYPKSQLAGSMMDNFHLVRLAKSIMRIAERETGKPIYHNAKLLEGLVNHLAPSISRLKMQMDIRNPLLGEMQTHFPELMKLTKKSVAELEAELGVELPPSEVAYIAMHLSAALTDMDLLKKMKHSVIVACPTGMGTSRLLASRLRQHYEDFIIVDLVSSLQITESYFEQHDAELVVSTVPIPKSPVPVVVVSALLSAEDRQKLDMALLALSEQSVDREIKKKGNALDFHKALARMGAYNQAIQDLLDGFFSIEDKNSMSVQEVAREIGEEVATTKEQAKGIMDALLRREDQGGTAITGNNMILMHCRSPYVRKLQFGIVHVGRCFHYPGEPTEKIRTAIVMLAPEFSSCYELETIGHISAILLERWGLMEVLHEGNRERIYEELLEIFKAFYQKKYQELMEG